MSEDMAMDPGLAPEACVAPTYFLDSDHPAVAAFVEAAVAGRTGEVDKALGLYYAVRDSILYDPYGIDLTPEAFRASRCLADGRGFCVTKAGLLAAAARAAGLPARLGFADVRNHLSTERLRRLMQTDVFHWHGYAEIHLEGRWVKATPAFNLELCRRFRVLPLDWDGRTDSVFHPFDADGRRHMEYVGERGSFPDLPFAAIRDTFVELYPEIVKVSAQGGDFAREAEDESSARPPGTGSAAADKL